MNANLLTAPSRALVLTAAAGVALACGAAGARPGDPYPHLPKKVSLTGVVRDFRASNNGGHPDFQRQPTGGFGHYMGMMQDALDSEGKPVWASTGFKVNTQWKDAQGRQRMRPRPYMLAMPGDVNGSMSTSQGGAITTKANFAQWFRDIPGVNMSDTLLVEFNREENTNKYVFDDKEIEEYLEVGGFFPINGALYGNYSSTGKNFHFTYELDTTFKHEKGKKNWFKFTGDDDVAVFINGLLVIDIGGVHSAVSQVIDVDRLTHIQDGELCTLKFFFAERHTTQSNFRIETTLNLVPVSPPATAALYD